MYQGKHVSKKTPRKSRKPLLILASLALVVCTAIGGTLAWLTDDTNAVTNTFTPGKVPPKITESFDGNVKSNVQIRNDGNINAFIRAKVVITWKKGDDVHGQKPVEGTDYIISYGNGWTPHDGYWYCNTAIAPGALTPALIETCTSENTAPDGYTLSVEILAQSIQSEPTKAAQEAWGYVPGSPAN